MAYIKHDVNNNPLPDTSTPVPDRCGAYNIYNKFYVRTNKDCGPATQPAILQGWNADYVPVTPGKATSEQTVKQTVYIKSDVNCQDITAQWECYTPKNTDNALTIGMEAFAAEGNGVLFLQTEESTPNYDSLILIPQ